jgi:hypothetical protein
MLHTIVSLRMDQLLLLLQTSESLSTCNSTVPQNEKGVSNDRLSFLLKVENEHISPMSVCVLLLLVFASISVRLSLTCYVCVSSVLSSLQGSAAVGVIERESALVSAHRSLGP